jgi:hypothetical protein
MKGQWIGEYSGSSQGLMRVDVDEIRGGFEGTAVLDLMNRGPKSFVAFKIASKERHLKFQCPVGVLHNGQVQNPENLRGVFPDIVFPTTADVTAQWDDESLSLEWSTDIGTIGAARLPRSSADRPSELVPLKLTWDEFKAHVSRLPPRGYVFRGQERPWRLRTSFHRSGRACLERFLVQDIPALHKHLSARTRHFFNLNVPDENGAFMNLIQHHGYPTPLLDWTYSPFVAAYFAFANISKQRALNADDDDVVRILLINRDACIELYPPLPFLTGVGLHFSLMEFSSVENERMIPQQAISAVSTIDDIEDYLTDKRPNKDVEVLSCIDISTRYRAEAMCDLGMMGITPGSLFPGLDGACKELRDRFFDQ